MTNKCYTMSIRLTPETRDALRKRAEREQRAPGDLVRLWILEKLKEPNE